MDPKSLAAPLPEPFDLLLGEYIHIFFTVQDFCGSQQAQSGVRSYAHHHHHQGVQNLDPSLLHLFYDRLKGSSKSFTILHNSLLLLSLYHKVLINEWPLKPALVSFSNLPSVILTVKALNALLHCIPVTNPASSVALVMWELNSNSPRMPLEQAIGYSICWHTSTSTDWFWGWCVPLGILQ